MPSQTIETALRKESDPPDAMENTRCSRPSKRRRTSSEDTGVTKRNKKSKALVSPPTPPVSDHDLEANDDPLLKRATHILATEAAALSHITWLYKTDATARQSLLNAVDAVNNAQRARGKLIICGVGKSAYIGMKLVATCKSLGIAASFMHACEAVHGDLGDVRADDVLLFVSFSGKTPELLSLLPHIPDSTRIIAMTSHLDRRDCALLARRKSGILLSAPIPESEETSYGVSAPTTSTTVALAVADMLALTVAQKLHSGEQRSVFKRNHPGGAIGMNHQEAEQLSGDGVDFSVVEVR